MSRLLDGEVRSLGSTPNPVGITAPLRRRLRGASACMRASESRRGRETGISRGPGPAPGETLTFVVLSGNRPPGLVRGGLARPVAIVGTVGLSESEALPRRPLELEPESPLPLLARGAGPSAPLALRGRGRPCWGAAKVDEFEDGSGSDIGGGCGESGADCMI